MRFALLPRGLKVRHGYVLHVEKADRCCGMVLQASHSSCWYPLCSFPQKGWICLTKLCDAPAAAQALPSHPFCSAAAETFCMFAECKITQIDFCLVLIRISVLEVVVDFFPFPFPLLLLPVWILFVIHVIAVAMSSLQISLKEIHGREVLSSWCFQSRIYDSVNKYAGASEAALGNGSALTTGPWGATDEGSTSLWSMSPIQFFLLLSEFHFWEWQELLGADLV